MRGKRGRMIRVIAAYRVSQDSSAQAGETTSCKEQVMSLMPRGVKKPNPKKRFIEDLSTMITNWRLNREDCDMILMADMNKLIGGKPALHEFCQRTNLIDSIFLLNPDLHEDPTNLWAPNRLITSSFIRHWLRLLSSQNITTSTRIPSVIIKTFISSLMQVISLIRKLWIGAMHPIKDFIWGKGI